MRKLIFTVLMLLSCSAALAVQISAPCEQSARAAYEAYISDTMDAKHPNMRSLALTLDYRLSQQPFPYDEKQAYMALGYITRRLRDAGVRTVRDYEVSAVAGEFIQKECMR